MGDLGTQSLRSNFDQYFEDVLFNDLRTLANNFFLSTEQVFEIADYIDWAIKNEEPLIGTLTDE